MKRVVVFGAGRVGALIATDLAADPAIEVAIADRSREALERLAARAPVETRELDLREPAQVRAAAGPADVVVGAVPGALGFGLVETLIEAGRPVVDISFFPEDPYLLEARARSAGVPVVVDCGVAPGISNLLAGLAARELDTLESVRILVGGLPSNPVPPWEYRAVFSPADVIEEYVRPCRMKLAGEEVVVPALTAVEVIDVAGVGTLEAFNTDGLRTLLRTSPARTLIEKTLRWPGHAEKVRFLRDAGFFDAEPLPAGDGRLVPRDLTLALLAREWAPAEGETEFTFMRVEAEGEQGGKPTRILWDLHDRTDARTGTTSMARTSGYPAAIVARLVATGGWSHPGVVAPEALAREPGLAEAILGELARRGIRIRRESGLA